uniref:Uncharacterized protein n=1 Tax=Panagrolaimus sp. PS1159 TaxID=55785 RepID=A0AC35GXL9_9BILA
MNSDDDDDVSLMPPSAKKRRIFCELGFRESYLNYLKRNANPRVLLKLMQVSKYFWLKEFPFTVIKDLKYKKNKWKFRPLQWPKPHFFDTRKFQPFDFDNNSKQLWITESLSLDNEKDTTFASSIISRVAVCDATTLDIENQRINENELKLFNGDKVEEVFFLGTMITDFNGEILPVENVLQLLPSVSDFSYCFDDDGLDFTPESTMNIIEHLKVSAVKTFDLENIPETFDFDAFFKFMHENPKKKYDLSFSYDISAEYIQKLQSAVDYFIDNCLNEESSVLIDFFGQTDESYVKLWNTW